MVSDSTIIYVDFSKPLPELIKPIRDYLEDKPEGHSLGIYIVAGNYKNNDIELFIEYLKSIKSSFNFIYYIRGLIHSTFIHLLFEENVFIQSNTKLIYDNKELHEMMKNLMNKPEIFRKFIQRFIDHYHKFPKQFYIDLTELETIGFTINKF